MTRSRKDKLGRFYTAADLADRLQIERAAVYQMAQAGELPAYRIGRRRLRFRDTDVEAYLRRCLVRYESDAA